MKSSCLMYEVWTFSHGVSLSYWSPLVAASLGKKSGILLALPLALSKSDCV